MELQDIYSLVCTRDPVPLRDNTMLATKIYVNLSTFRMLPTCMLCSFFQGKEQSPPDISSILDAKLDASSLNAQLLLQVHDELVLEVPVSELEATTAMVKDAMENAVSLDVPLNVDFGHGKNWLEAH